MLKWKNCGVFFTLTAMFVLAVCGTGCGDDGGPSCDDVINACTVDGASQCSGNIIQTCAEDLDGCLAWVNGTNCLTNGLTCDDTSGTAECVCTDLCATAGETQCSGEVIQTCTAGADLCLDWVSGTDCSATGRACDDSAEPAVCECVDACTTVGETQCALTVIETCTADAQGCLDWVGGTDCDATGQVCDDSAEPAACACENDCATAGETQCSGTVIQACTANAGGCLKWVDGLDCATDNRTCDDTAEPAVCRGTCTDLASATGQVATGNNTTALDEHQGSCTTGADGLDDCYLWTAPADGLFLVDTCGSALSDTVLIVYDESDTEIGCNDDSCSLQSEVPVTVTAGQQIKIVVDGWGASNVGDYVLNVNPVPPESVCDDFSDNDFDDLVDCADPTDCQVAAACVPGSGAPGDACTASTDCAANNNDPACLTDDMGWPEGYCSEWCDLANPDCPAGSFCMDLGAGAMGLCIDACDRVAEPCRPGFFCCYNADFDADVCQPDFWTCVINCEPNSPADVIEAADATNNAVYWEWSGPAFVAGPGTAEDTGLTLVNDTTYTIEGTGADNGDEATAASDYMDVDTFLFNAGTADDIYVVLDAAGTAADMDVIITDTSYNMIAGPGRIANGSADTLDGIYEEEFRISENGLYVPGADYLVSVGVYCNPADFCSSGLPKDWQLSMCTVSCSDACIFDATRCSGAVVQTCVLDTNGCTIWEDTTDCSATGDACDDSAEPAICVCVDECAVENETQCDGTIIQTCTMGGDGCLDLVDGQDCATNGEICDDRAEPAVCVTPTACTDLGSATGAVVPNGDNTNSLDEYLGGCTSGSGGLDDCYEWTAPADGDYVIDTCGSSIVDTVLIVYDDGGTVIGCNDDSCSLQSEVALTLTSGQKIKIVVDGYSATHVGSYVLNIGELAACAPNSPVDQTEAADATNNAVYWTGDGAFISGPGTAEATNLTFAPGTIYTIEGASTANGEDTAAGNDYIDVDTFIFNSGTAADIHLVLDAAGTSADLDVLITDTAYNPISIAWEVGNCSANTLDGIYEEEFYISDYDLYVPGTDYLVSVGVYTGSAGLPADWQLTMCAE